MFVLEEIEKRYKMHWEVFRFVVIYLVFVRWKLTWTQSFTAHMPNFKQSGTAMSALGNTALMGTEKIPSYE